jgi:septum formation inhibitor MinC
MILVPFRALLPSALGALLLLAVPVHAQQLYKWVDSNGRVQYSDRKPPDGKQVQEVRSTVSSIGSQGAGAGGKSPSELEKDFQKRQQEQTEAQQKQQQTAAAEKQKSTNCAAARSNLAALNSGQRVARFNSQGERVYLDDAARASEVEHAQQAVKANCG